MCATLTDVMEGRITNYIEIALDVHLTMFNVFVSLLRIVVFFLKADPSG